MKLMYLKINKDAIAQLSELLAQRFEPGAAELERSLPKIQMTLN